jgi:hypothetical protein
MHINHCRSQYTRTLLKIHLQTICSLLVLTFNTVNTAVLCFSFQCHPEPIPSQQFRCSNPILVSSCILLFNFFVSNQQSQYSVFHKLMCWHSLTFRLPNMISPLQQISYTVLQVGWGALNLNSTDCPDHGHLGDSPLSGKKLHVRAGNRTRDLIISSQKR